MNLGEVEAVQALRHETPTTVPEVRKLMGFLSYYRPYISDLAKPLYELLAKPKAGQKNTQKKKGYSRQTAQLPPSHPIQWTETHQEILSKLIDQLTNPPIMLYADLKKPFIVHTDASEEALVLFYTSDKREHSKSSRTDPGHCQRPKGTTSYTLVNWNSLH